VSRSQMRKKQPSLLRLTFSLFRHPNLKSSFNPIRSLMSFMLSYHTKVRMRLKAEKDRVAKMEAETKAKESLDNAAKQEAEFLVGLISQNPHISSWLFIFTYLIQLTYRDYAPNGLFYNNTPCLDRHAKRKSRQRWRQKTVLLCLSIHNHSHQGHQGHHGHQHHPRGSSRHHALPNLLKKLN